MAEVATDLQVLLSSCAGRPSNELNPAEMNRCTAGNHVKRAEHLLKRGNCEGRTLNTRELDLQTRFTLCKFEDSFTEFISLQKEGHGELLGSGDSDCGVVHVQ